MPWYELIHMRLTLNVIDAILSITLDRIRIRVVPLEGHEAAWADHEDVWPEYRRHWAEGNARRSITHGSIMHCRSSPRGVGTVGLCVPHKWTASGSACQVQPNSVCLRRELEGSQSHRYPSNNKQYLGS